MATSAKGAYEGATGGGGVGGKFRKRAFKQPPKPYARPPAQSGIRQSYQAAKDAFVSKLVDPAKDVIARSAHSLFASLFRKRLTAPPLVPEARRVSRNEVQQATTTVPNFGAQERANNEHDKQISGTGDYGIKEIEEVFKQKTFTKAEIDRLTELLQSRTVTVSGENNKNSSMPSTSRLEAAHEFQEHKRFSMQGNQMENTSRGLPAAALNSSVPKQDVASAAELAKAYMGNASLNVSPLNLSSHSQAFRKDTPLLTNVPYTPSSSGMAVAPSFTAGVTENGYSMPRARGRSAIYNMARTPNSRVYESATGKVDVYGASSSSQLSLENGTHSSGKQALKRRSSVFNSDMGSIGSIRRIRQKTNMMSPPKTLSLPTSGSPFPVSSAVAQGSRSVRQKQMFVNGPKDISNILLAESEDNRISNSGAVPPRSSQMAEKILQLLDKAVPSPKEKASEIKLAADREKSPSKLTRNMLHGKALRSLEDVDSSKLLHDVTSNRRDGSQLREARDSASHKQARLDNGDHTPNAASSSKLAIKENGFTDKASKENVPDVKTSAAATSSDVSPSPKQLSFRMSAHEDSGDDSDDGVVTLQTETKETDKSATESKAIVAETEAPQNHPVPLETSPPSSSKLNEDANSKASTASTSAGKTVSFALPVTASSTSTTELTPTTSKAPLFSNGPAPLKEPTEAPIFSFGSKSADKVAPFKFSPKDSGANDSLHLNSEDKIAPFKFSPKDSSANKSLHLNSEDKIAPFKFSSQDSGANESLHSTFGAPEPKITETSITSVFATPEVPKSDEKDNSEKSKDIPEPPQNIFSSPASTSTSTNIFSFGASSNGPKPNGKPLPFSFSSPISTAQVSNGSSDVIFSASTTTSTTVTTTTTTTTPSIATMTTPSPAPSIFKFGSGSLSAPSSSSPLPTFGVQSTNSEQKEKEKEKTVSPFTFGTSSSSQSTSSIFGFTASTTTSTSSTPNPFGAPVGSVFGSTQPAPAEAKSGSGPAPFTTTMPSFGLSAPSSSIFGLTPSSSLTAGTSVFGSSTTSSSSGFGLSSSTTPSVFGSGFGSGTTTTPSTTGFSFGASTSTPTPTPPVVFGSNPGSSPAPVFSFTQAQPVFGAPSPTLQFGSTSNNNDQMSMEDSMAEDTMQSSTPVGSVFGQGQTSNFAFGSGPLGGSPFAFGGQPSIGTPQTQSPFQPPSGNLEFSAGGSFSLGTGGGDKSGRRIIKPKRSQPRRRQ